MLSSHLIHRWSTDSVPAAARLDYWVGAICEAFLEMDCSPLRKISACFDGELAGLPVGELRLNQVIASPSKVVRSAAAIARSQSQPFYLITDLHQPWRIRQGGIETDLRPKDLALVDSSQEYEFDFPSDVKNMSIEIPRRWLEPRLLDIDTTQPRKILHDRGWGRSLSALCGQFADDPLLSLAYPSHLLTDQIGATLSACLDEASPSTSSKRGVVQTAVELMKQRLSEADVTAADISFLMGISSRTLHRCFAAEGLAFARIQRDLRMNYAAQILSQKRFCFLDMAAVGRRCGINDASNFVREFHRSFGCTPARWRKNHLHS
jgi:AraC family transcriptional regulator, positive regulator of tynA and feaB